MSLPEINLILQSLILIVFFVSIFFKIKGKFVIHGTLMLFAVTSSIVVFLLISPVIMNEKASSITNYIQLFFDSPINTVFFALHTTSTVIAVLLGVWVVSSWRFRSKQFCAPKKKIMRLISLLWILGYIAGLFIHLFLNTNLIN